MLEPAMIDDKSNLVDKEQYNTNNVIVNADENVANMNEKQYGKKIEDEVSRVPVTFREAKRISCTKQTALFLCFLVLIAVILSAVISALMAGTPCNSSYTSALQSENLTSNEMCLLQPQLEDESDDDLPERAELPIEKFRLPKSLSPIWYNLTVKTFLPGYSKIPSEKHQTFDASIIISFHVNYATDKIVLNTRGLTLPDRLASYKIMHVEENEIDVIADQNVEEISTITENGLPANQTEDMNYTRPEQARRRRHSSHYLSRSRRGNDYLFVTRINTKPELMLVEFELNNMLTVDENYLFEFSYSGAMNMSRKGLQVFEYTEYAGEKRFLAITDMTPYARYFVPCFDEPEFKAVWKLKVEHPKGTVALSSTLQEFALDTEENEISTASDENSEWITTSFEETPKFSTNSLALVVTSFSYNEGLTKNGLKVRIWSRTQSINSTNYALKSAIEGVEFLEGLLKVPIPLKKLDITVLPTRSPVVVSWGCIAIYEESILYSPEQNAERTKFAIKRIIVHQLAHQWFGNLVSLKWWDELWLNNGFASLIGDFVFDEEKSLLHETMNEALEIDAHSFSHPVMFPVKFLSELKEINDQITFQKSPAIIRMVEKIIGTDIFENFLTSYLNEKKYSNVDHNDLWNSLSQFVSDELKSWDGSKFNLHSFVSMWFEQMGYPIVEVHRIDNNTVELRQTRFKWNQNILERKKYRNARYWYKFDIPIWHEINGEVKPLKWLHEAESIDVNIDDLLVLNKNSQGFYRTNYDITSWGNFEQQLKIDHHKIDTISRMRIINDAFSLAYADYIPYERALNLTSYMGKEDEYLPLSVILNGFHRIILNFGDETEIQEIRDYIIATMESSYEQIQWPEMSTAYNVNGDLLQKEFDYALIRRFCLLRYGDCTRRMMKYFVENFVSECKDKNKMASECSRIKPYVRTLAYCEGIRSSGDDIWNMMLEFYATEEVLIEKSRLLKALSCSRDSITIKRLLNIATGIKEGSISELDACQTISNVAHEDFGSLVLFNYLQDYWDRINITNRPEIMNCLIKYATKTLKNDREIDQLTTFMDRNKKFVKKYPILKQQLLTARSKNQWLERNFKKLSKWFRQRNEELRSK